AVGSGVFGRIAVTYIEWAGDGVQMKILDWKLIDGPAAAKKFANVLSESPIESGPWTSISGLITYALPQFENNGYEGTRRVIDISGDGPNNSGVLVTEARSQAIAKRVTINGLPIINDRLQPSGHTQLEHLDRYYAACVIGGPGAFLVVAHDFKDFGRAIRRKLLFEIANLALPGEMLRSALPRSATPIAMDYPLGCDIGERRLQQRRLRFDNEL
ncbi:MAG: DUF1194 domain-containing protein, partial [Rhodospirillales bacterium]|nr:DUF1194 domain-containing protein [Rhodospirillales bacterium]